MRSRRRRRRMNPYRQDGQREQKAHCEAVVVEWILPGPHWVVLKADRLVLLVSTQLLVEEEDNTDRELLQPNDGADKPSCTHRAQEGEPGKERRQANVRRSASLKAPSPHGAHPPERMDHG